MSQTKISFGRQMKALIKLSLLDLWRRNDVWGLLILAGVLMFPLMTLDPFGTHGANRYAAEVAMLLIWAFSLFVSIGTGSRLFPPEFESRTILPLLTKPASRFRLLFGKYLGAVVASVSALALFYGLFAMMTVLHGGAWWSTEAFIQAFILHLGFVMLATAFSLTLSLFVTPSANWSISAVVLAGMFFFARSIPAGASVFYWTLPHVELFDMRQRLIHEWGSISWGILAIAFLYAILYSGALLALASFILKRKRA